ncbi:hypothetical protein V2J09_015782 [Rumex salicifolius]
MNKAKNVVETWNKQFHSSPREQRLPFLYLANDILQNSRRKGADFVAEFWKVLPDALRDVIQNGDASGKNQALRLINIWDERKVFGSRGHILKDEFVGRQPENSAKIGRQLSFKLRQSAGSSLDNIVSGYETIYGGQLDEDVILSQCTNVISSMEKVKKDVSSNMASGQLDGAKFVEEFKRQHAVLRGCIDQLTAVEDSRARLVSHLREALHEQELKLDQVRSQLQAALSQADQAANMFQHPLNSSNIPLGDDQVSKETRPPTASQAFTSGPTELSSPVQYTRQAPFPEKSAAMDGKSAAAAVAAKLTASTSSAQMLTFVLSSLAQEGVIGTGVKESASSTDYPPEKKLKVDNDQSYVPQPTSQQQSLPTNSGDSKNLIQNQPLSSSPPPLPPLMPPYPMAQYMQTAGPMSNVPYSYGSATPQPLPPMPGYPSLAPPQVPVGSVQYAPQPPNPYQSFQGTESGFYPQQPAPPMAPISRQ